MDKIRIGRGPDYCMMQGYLLLSYKAKVYFLEEAKETKTLLISDRSLVMILKKLTPIISNFKTEDNVNLESVIEQNELIGKLKSEKMPQMTVKLVLPKDLTSKQRADINGHFIKQMKALL